MKHIYIQTAFLGDLLLSIPALKAIRGWDKDSELTLVCRAGLGELMKRLKLCDHVIEVDKKDQRSLNEFEKQIDPKGYDYLFCAHQSMRSHKWSQKIKAKHKIGYKKFWNSNIFSKRVSRDLSRPEAIRQLALIATCDLSLKTFLDQYIQNVVGEKYFPVPEWAKMSVDIFSESDVRAVEKKIGINLSGTSYVCLAPGSVWETKRWTKEGFTELGQKISAQGHKVLFIGAPNEKPLVDSIVKEVKDSESLAGQFSIWESLVLLSQAKYLVCNDSGAMHMASVTGIPTYSIFGPTVLELGYRPWNTKAQVMEVDLPCRPCGQHGSKACPIGTHACMKQVTAESVWIQISETQ